MGQEHGYANIQRAVLSTPWAIDPGSLAWAAIVDVLALRTAGQALSLDEITARIEAANNGPRAGARRDVGVARLPVYGVLSARQNLMAQTSGGTSAEAITQQFRAALASPEVDAIVFDIDSPGGAVDGMSELWSEVRAARGRKPIVSVINHTGTSAAYWFASAADEIVATPSAVVGSIGVFTAHDDLTEAQAKLGIKRTVISAGKFKVEGALGQSLTDDAKAHIQGQVEQFFSMMVADIAKGRGVGVDAVRTNYGQGRTMLAKDALAAGMVDRIDTLDNTELRVAREAARQPRGLAALSDPSALDPEPVPFSARLSLVSAAARELADHATARADMRAKEGRSLTPGDRAGLLAVADSLRDVAGEVEEEPVAEPSPSTDWRPKARLALQLAQAELDFELTGATNG